VPEPVKPEAWDGTAAPVLRRTVQRKGDSDPGPVTRQPQAGSQQVGEPGEDGGSHQQADITSAQAEAVQEGPGGRHPAVRQALLVTGPEVDNHQLIAPPGAPGARPPGQPAGEQSRVFSVRQVEVQRLRGTDYLLDGQAQRRFEGLRTPFPGPGDAGADHHVQIGRPVARMPQAVPGRPGRQGERVLTRPGRPALVDAGQPFQLDPGVVPGVPHQLPGGQSPAGQLHAGALDPAPQVPAEPGEASISRCPGSVVAMPFIWPSCSWAPSLGCLTHRQRRRPGEGGGRDSGRRSSRPRPGRDEVDHTRVPGPGGQQVDEGGGPAAVGERRPAVAARQAAAFRGRTPYGRTAGRGRW